MLGKVLSVHQTIIKIVIGINNYEKHCVDQQNKAVFSF